MDLIVGEGSLEISEIAKCLRNSPSFAVLIQHWRSFGYTLGIKDVKILDLERKLNRGTLELEDIPREQLKIWKANKGSEASFKLLYDALVNSNMQDIAEFLQKTFCPQFEFSIYGKHFELEDPFKDCSTLTRQKIYHALKKHHPTHAPFFSLVKEQLCPPKEPNFYIPRTVSFRSKINSKIFTAPSMKEHIFLVQNISKNDLAKVTGYQPVDITGNQLDHISVRFMLLECEEDFDIICQKTTKPVHVLQFNKNGSYYWIKSSKNEGVQNFIGGRGNYFAEDELVTMITVSQRRSHSGAFCISDSPGMGKTLLLANLAIKIMETKQDTIVLFIVLQEFLQHNYYIDSTSSAIDALADYAATPSAHDSARLVLKQILKSGSYQFYIFLDGYDEVGRDKLDSADKFLIHMKEAKQITITVTTRPHLKSHLENILKLLSYEILPFTEPNQVEFLTRYWVSTHGARNNLLLEKFGEECLSALQSSMTDYERKIAGIPLQCMMLAEVYARDAIRYSKMKTASATTVVKVSSFFEMYKSLVNLKFSRVQGDDEVVNGYISAHVYDAIALLFPEWIGKLDPQLNNNRISINENILYAIGLMEKSVHTNMPRFVHRTFAEYSLAEFLVKNMSSQRACLDLIFTVIFGRKGVKSMDQGYGPVQLKLEYPVIGYFIDMHLKDYLSSNGVIDVSFLSQLCDEEDLYLAVKASCCHGLENCFNLAVKLLCLKNIGVEELEANFRYLPHMSVDCLKNSSAFLINVLEISISKFGVSPSTYNPKISYEYEYPWIPNYNALHVAIYHGNYNVVMYLIREYGENIRFMQHPLHVCVRESTTNSDSVIEDKLSIIDVITDLAKKYNTNWLEETFEEVTPIMQENVHLKLLQRLVKAGGNINAYSTTHGTILHQATDKNTYTELVRWAFSSGFKLINCRDKFKRTPLIRAIGRFGIVDYEVLHLFHKAGADFNAENEDGESVLFYALSKAQSPDFIAKILDYGANVNHRNKEKQNAAHVVIGWNSLRNADEVLSILELLDSRGFWRMNEKDSDKKTPLLYAEEGEHENQEILDFLRYRTSKCCCLSIFKLLRIKSSRPKFDFNENIVSVQPIGSDHGSDGT